ncbi:NRAMP (natural resistance-associated macrophage protein)-like metal ion transporter [Rhizobium sp. BK313]|uniref:NRAMP family divalent metal transporter n=1 Tax=Rhizobium sp. BK313 TaxID=2587081 RepID=UPI00105C8987|nr:divalent metal cation transporter [Rhizobium sp. BK313]MBB3452709.1 NRAMP (natural resistance-associated macrophage protein)-like metal ion transporter [Rhizobium sp. BK313]
MPTPQDDGDNRDKLNSVVEPSKPRILEVLGPGLITGASDDDPSGIATYSQVGARFAYGATWTLLFSYPLMVAIQIISGRLGRTTGRGVAGNLRKYYASALVLPCVTLLLLANTINIGADVGAMGDAAKLVLGGSSLLYVVIFGLASAALQVFLKYEQYVRVLKWLSLALLAYVATLFVVKIDWTAFAVGFFIPHITFSADFLTAIVAIFGTTISPYLFFWQASEEAEDLKEKPKRDPLKDHPEQAPEANQRITLDTFIGMGVSNFIALSIMVTAAATLNAHNITDINSSADAAKALEPIAGKFGEILFVIGIIGTGLLAVPVLAGSAAYGLGEALKWPTGLARKPREAKAFYWAITVATILGAALNFSSINPIDALYWSAVINGVVAVPIMVVMMLMATNSKVMGDHTIGPWLQFFGWLSTAAMALCAIGMVAAFFMK